MAEINVLDSSIFNRIAAGEVVESPKSVVKELIENSIDAGADKITVQIDNGGISSIRVSDNGKGLSSEDLPIAFLPHATSKIKNIKDLDNIATLGFRGEALPSIASVATVIMTSRTSGCELGHSVSYKNGTLLDSGAMGCPLGTSIAVNNIFENIPARAKFLKKPSQEEADISDLIMRFILAHPKLQFKYVANGEIKYQSAGEGIESAIFAVYGATVLDNLMSILHNTSHITLRGHVSKPTFCRHSRNYQTLIVNGRYVVNQELSFCIQHCYQEFLMRRQFPMYVLYLELPLDMVDVNIQPNKMNVKFVDFARLKGIIYNVIKDAVLMQATVPQNITSFMNTFKPAKSEFVKDFKNDDINNFASAESAATITAMNLNEVSKIGDTADKRMIEKQKPYNVFSSFSLNDISDKTSNANSSNFYEFNTSTNLNNKFDSKSRVLTEVKTQESANSFYNSEDFKIIGKLFNTYITIEHNNEILLIDQHAAHEKIIYEKLVVSVNSKKVISQDLLLPYVFEVSHNEKLYLIDALPLLNEIGFMIGALSGLYFSVSSIPVILSDLNLKDFVSTLLVNLEGKDFKKSSLYLKEKLMQTACKAAVKGEMDLSKNEIMSLMKEMNDSNVPLFCPHGRPITVKVNRSEIEKWFKRIQ